MGDFYRESLCRGGIPNPAFWHLLGQDLNGRNQIEDVIEMVKQYPIMNDYWEDISPQLSKITVPMYVLASYSSNLHTEGSIRGFKCSNSKEKW
jgi:predicted acyl esterase